MQKVVHALFDIGAIKFGSFTLKSGKLSPVYVDLRMLVAHPQVLEQVSALTFAKMQQMLQEANFSEQVTLCGVPYSALTIATCISVKENLPMILVRKEGAKTYGTKNMIEGWNSETKNIFIIEDVMTSGASIKETMDKIGTEFCKFALGFLDREQGAMQNLQQVKVGSVLTLRQVADVLAESGKISQQVQAELHKYVQENQVELKPTTIEKKQELTFEARAQLCTNAIGKQLFQIMVRKQSNLSVAADVATKQELLQLADDIGPYICMLKTHVDMLNDFDLDTAVQLEALAKKHDFVLFEDRKFADIGKVVKSQYAGGLYKIATWSHVTNAHLVSGATIIKGLQEAAQETTKDARGLLLIAKMSTVDASTNEQTAAQAWKAAKENTSFVFGFICQGRFAPAETKANEEQQFLYCTPGVNLQQSGDSLGQNYNTPAAVIGKGSDIVIVGTGIVSAKNRVAVAKEYQAAAWQAYLSRLQ